MTSEMLRFHHKIMVTNNPVNVTRMKLINVSNSVMPMWAKISPSLVSDMKARVIRVGLLKIKGSSHLKKAAISHRANIAIKIRIR